MLSIVCYNIYVHFVNKVLSYFAPLIADLFSILLS